VQTITLGNLTIWSRGGGDVHLTINPTYLDLTSAYTTSYIQVTCDDDSWTCEDNVGWMTASRTSSTQARIYVTSNTASTASRSGVVRFKVDDITYATLSVTQQGAANDPFPSGWDIIEEDGDWALAVRQQTNYYTFAIIYRYENTAPPSAYYANWDFDFEWEDEGDIQSDNLNGSQQIEVDDTFDYTSHIYYGIELGEVPNLDDSTISVNYFEVYAT
jgi:hypothetical protein